MWIEIDWVEFVIESSTKVDSPSRSTLVQFVSIFSTSFKSILVVIDSLFISFVERFLSRNYWEWFHMGFFWE